MKIWRLLALLFVFNISCEKIFFDDDNEADLLEIFDSFYSELDQNYAYFEYLKVDFDSVFELKRSLLEQNQTGGQLVESFDEIIQLLKDGRITVRNKNIEIRYTNWYENYPLNELPDITSYFDSYIRLNQFLNYGIIRDANIGYIKIKEFNVGTQINTFENVMDELTDTDGLIIDVRSGLEESTLSSDAIDIILHYFNDAQRVYLYSKKRSSTHRRNFDNWLSYHTTITPGLKYSKPIAILTNRKSYGSTELFLSKMRSIPYVTIIGDTTGGGIGWPTYKYLANNWSMHIANTQEGYPNQSAKGIRGIIPDIPVWITSSDSVRGIDTILEKAIEEIQTKSSND